MRSPTSLVHAWTGSLRARIATVVILASLVVVVALLDQRVAARDAEAVDAADVAKTSLESLLSYTPRNVSSGIETKRDLLTGDLADTYVEYLRDVVEPAAVENETTVRAEVVGAGVEDAGGGDVDLLVFLNVTTTEGDGEPTIEGSRFQVTMTEVDGSWRVSEMTAL